MAQDYHLFHVRSEEFSGIKTDYDLPFSDESYFVSGFLVDKQLPDEALIRTNEHNFGRKSNYYFGQTVLEDHEPKTGQDFQLQDKGCFMLTLSGPGYNNTDNHSKFEDRWEKLSIKDVLTIKPDFTWERKKETDIDFFLTWNGTYSYSGDLIVFSLTEQGASGYVFDTVENYIPYYGLIYGPIRNDHVIDKPMEGRISGLISDYVSGMIKGFVSGTASCTGYGMATKAIGESISENQSILVNHETSAKISDTVRGTITGIIEEYKEGLAKGIARNTEISGYITGNVHNILSNSNASCTGYGTATNVLGKTDPATFSINGLVRDYIYNTMIRGQVNKTVDNVTVSGTINKTVDNVLFSCRASGYANNVYLNGLISGTTDVLISGLITGIVDNILVSGMASGYADNTPVSGYVNGIVNNVLVNGIISQAISMPISGTITSTADNVTAEGILSGYIPMVTLSGMGNTTVTNCILSGYIEGEVNGEIKIKSPDIIDNEFVSGTMVDTFKTNLYNSVSSSIGTNEVNYFGSSVAEIRITLQNAINNIIDRESFYNIIASTYLSKDGITDLTDKILLDMIIANGNYIKGDAKFLEALKGKISVDGDASLAGDIVGGEVTVDQGTGYINPNTSTDSGGQSAHNHTRNGYTTPNTTGGGGTDGHTHGFNDYYEALSNSDIRHTHPIGEKGVTVNTGYGDITGGKTSITNGTIDIDEADFTANIPNETDIEIRGANISSFRNILLTKIKNTIISIMSNIQIKKLVYGIVKEFPISQIISGPVSGKATVTAENRVTGTVYGTISGVNEVTIKGEVTDNFSYDINGLISSISSSEIEGIGYGTAHTLAYAPGIGDVVVDKEIILSVSLDDSFSDFSNFYKISGSNGVVSEVTHGVNRINPGGRGQLSKYFIFSTDYPTNMIYDVGVYSGCILEYSYYSGLLNGRDTYISGYEYDTTRISGLSGYNSWYEEFLYNTNTRIKIGGLPYLEAVIGNETEFPAYNNNFGGIGGNVIQNSFDFFQKNIPEQGFVKIIYANPSLSLQTFRTLEISGVSGIEVLPDVTEGIISGSTIENIQDTSWNIINKMVVENESDVYYRILRRDEELDLQKSTLNGSGLYQYNVKYEEPEYKFEENYNDRERLLRRKYSNNEIYITELDNHRRKLEFKTPFRSNISGDAPELIKLDLQTTKRKFYFAIARDNEIDTVKINNILFHPDDQDKDGSYRKRKRRDENDNVLLDKDGNPMYYEGNQGYGFIAGASFKIEVRFKNEPSSLMKELIRNYLSDCLEKDDIGNITSISKSNNYIQTINNFKMPERDVLLFLKTEQTYMLNIFRDAGSLNLIKIEHNKTVITSSMNPDIPIIIRHFKDDLIIIEISFNDPFIEIDREYLESQLIDVPEIRYNDYERPYIEYRGFVNDVPQTITFLMPTRDVTLHLRQKGYRHKVKLLRERTSKNFITVSLKGSPDNPYTLRTETNNVLYNDTLWTEILYLKGDYVVITVHFEADEYGRYLYEIDQEYMKAQMSSIIILPRVFISNDNKYEGFDGPDQKIAFTMPDSDVELVIKEKPVIKYLTIKPDHYQFKEGQLSSSPRIIEEVIFEEGSISKSESFSFATHEGRTFATVEKEQINIYIRFSDIKQHIDKSDLNSQWGDTFIYEAGVNVKDEYWQLISFTMPDEDITLRLKWEERLFAVELNFLDLFFLNLSIFDNNRNKGIIPLPQSNFPYYTYPCYLSDEDDKASVTQNQIRLFSSLSESTFVDNITTIPEELAYDQLAEPIEVKEKVFMSSFDIQFLMPKCDVEVSLDIVTFTEYTMLVAAEYSTGSINLIRGKYQIYFAGAKGGGQGAGGGNGSWIGGGSVSGGAIGNYGSGDSFILNVYTPTILEYKIGQGGGNGAGGSAGSSGFLGIGGSRGGNGGAGGGGGASILFFDTDVYIVVNRFINPFKGMVRTIGANGGTGGAGTSGGDPDIAGRGSSGGGGGGNGSFSIGIATFGGQSAHGAGGIGGMGHRFGTKAKEIKDTIKNTYTPPSIDWSKDPKKMDKYLDEYRNFHKPPHPGPEPQLEDFEDWRNPEENYNEAHDEWEEKAIPYQTYLDEQKLWDELYAEYETKATSWERGYYPMLNDTEYVSSDPNAFSIYKTYDGLLIVKFLAPVPDDPN